VAQDANWDTAIFLCNPQAETVSVTLAFVDASGNPLSSTGEILPARGSGVYFLKDLIPAGSSHSQGSVEIGASRGVAGFAIYYDTQKRSGTCFAGISAVPME
jgi:hypothetical protein